MKIQDCGIGSRVAAPRWAHFVLKVLDSDHDLTTIEAWASHVAVGKPVLERVCGAVGIRPKRSLDFARMLRVSWLIESRRNGDELLATADSRTLKRLFNDAGVRDDSLPLTVGEFLARQRFVTSPTAIGLIRDRLLADNCADAGRRNGVRTTAR